MVAAWRDLYPFESRWRTLVGRDGSSLRQHYLDEGQGDPLVFVHGNPSWSFLWRSLVAPLRARYRCVVPDHVGMGLSDKPSEAAYEHTLDRRVDDLEALLDGLGLRGGLTLVLHDWGGMIGLAFAQRHPGRVQRLILMNTAGFLLPQGRGLPWQLRLARSAPSEWIVRGLNGFVLGAAATCAARPLRGAVRAGFLAPYDSWEHRLAVHRFVADIPLGPQDPAYATVQAVTSSLPRLRDRPVLLLWGERDFVFDRHFLAEWRRRLPEAETHTFPSAGHYLLEDVPDPCLELVSGFLDRHPLAPEAEVRP